MKEFSYENQEGNSYMVYRIDKDEQINKFVFEMVANNNVEGILRMSKFQMNSDVQVRYHISGKRRLNDYLKNERVNAEQLLDILYNIFQTIVYSKDYMIREEEFILDTEYIYIDMFTNKPYMVCCPVKTSRNEKVSIEVFIKDFVYAIGYVDAEVQKIVQRLLNIASEKCSGIEMFRNKIRQELEKASYKRTSNEYTQLKHQTQEKYHYQEVENINVKLQTEQKKKEMVNETSSEMISKSKQSNEFAIPGIDNTVQAVRSSNNQKTEKYKDKKKKYGVFGKLSKTKKEKTDNNIIHPIVPNKVKCMQNSVPIYQNINNQPNSENTELNNDTVIADDMDIKEYPYLLRLSTKEKIVIDKDYFKLGRSGTQSDYKICNNESIGRFHAIVIRRGNDYFLTDAGSINHTFVEGKKLEQGEEMLIVNNSSVRLSNEDFIFKK